MDDYDCVRKSSLKFKGQKKKKRKRSSDKDKADNSISTEGKVGDTISSADCQDNNRLEDSETHGGWWKIDRYEEIKDDVAIEFLPGCYAKALSDGTIVLGSPHPPGEGPDEEEIFTAVCASTNQLALKSGFGRYLNVDTKKHLMGLSEAIGEQELFLPVFEDGKLALCAYNDCFLSPDEETETQPIVAKSTKAGAYEMLTIRVNHDPKMFGKEQEIQTADELVGNVYQAELGYLKKFQARPDKPSGSLKEDKKLLKKARLEGQLHEALLDRRVKSRSDKYCK